MCALREGRISQQQNKKKSIKMWISACLTAVGQICDKWLYSVFESGAKNSTFNTYLAKTELRKSRFLITVIL